MVWSNTLSGLKEFFKISYNKTEIKLLENKTFLPESLGVEILLFLTKRTQFFFLNNLAQKLTSADKIHLKT